MMMLFQHPIYVYLYFSSRVPFQQSSVDVKYTYISALKSTKRTL